MYTDEQKNLPTTPAHERSYLENIIAHKYNFGNKQITE